MTALRPMAYEDFEVGRPFDFGRYEVTRAEIIAFARLYDPQPMHLDEDAARATIAGGLCASGFHTCAMFMRMQCDAFLNRSTSLGSPGLDEVKWLKPVRPGDVLSGRLVCREKRVSRSRPDMGLCRNHYECRNQAGEIVMTWEGIQLFRLRSPGAATDAAR